jgi:hypothetical protein
MKCELGNTGILAIRKKRKCENNRRLGLKEKEAKM